MSKLLLILGIVAVGLLGLAFFAMPSGAWGYQPSGQSVVRYNTPKGVVSVQWGYSGSKVEYLAFSFDGTDEPPVLVTTGTSTIGPVDLVVPGREPRAFPLEANVFEWEQGQFAEKRVRLDLEDVSEYCRSPHKEFCIADLEAFLEAR